MKKKEVSNFDYFILFYLEPIMVHIKAFLFSMIIPLFIYFIIFFTSKEILNFIQSKIYLFEFIYIIIFLLLYLYFYSVFKYKEELKNN